MFKRKECEVAQLCPTLCDPMDCSLPGSTIHGFSGQEYWSGLSKCMFSFAKKKNNNKKNNLSFALTVPL